MRTALLAIVALLPLVGGDAAPPTPDDASWTITLPDFFPGLAQDGGTRDLTIHATRAGGRWTAALGAAMREEEFLYNRALALIDLTRLAVQGDAVSGVVAAILPPDPWVPSDGRPRHAEITIAGKLSAAPGAAPALAGTWTATVAGTDDELTASGLERTRTGAMKGTLAAPPAATPADGTYALQLPGFLVGDGADRARRRIAIHVGVRGGQVVSLRHGEVDRRNLPRDLRPLIGRSGIVCGAQGIAGALRFGAETTDGDEAEYAIELQGTRIGGLVAGSWKGRATVPGADGATAIEGYFSGNVLPVVVDAPPDERPWYVPVPGHAPVAAGEHPRLFFRAGDVAELRRRAATPEGQRIVARLRQQLGGGDALPALFNTAGEPYSGKAFKPTVGAWTITHAAGFGMLHQLSGDAKHAQLARACVELAWQGRRDQDDAYAWVNPGGESRAATVLAWTAVAYDLCYHAWDDEFRTRVARAIQDYDLQGRSEDPYNVDPVAIAFRTMALRPRKNAASAVFGQTVGGCGLALLAIRGDPGTDDALLARLDGAIQRRAVRAFGGSFGDGGCFIGGTAAAFEFTDATFLPYLQALRCAAGRDYVTGPRRHAERITALRIRELVGPPGLLPARAVDASPGSDVPFADSRGGLARGGQFAQGFGAIGDELKPALLWTYNHVAAAADGDAVCDTVGVYPHRALLALVNWPIGLQERNPADTLPRVLRDGTHDYVVFRNRWQDGDDVVVTAMVNQPEGTDPSGAVVVGLGTHVADIAGPDAGPVTGFAATPDGSGWIAAKGRALVVDFGRGAGCDAVIVGIRPKGTSAVRPLMPKGERDGARARLTSLDVGRLVCQVLTLSADGRHPEPRADGDVLVVGGQRYAFDGAAVTMPETAPRR